MVKLKGSSIFEVVTALALVLIIFTIAIHAITTVMYLRNMELTIRAQDLLNGCEAPELVLIEKQYPEGLFVIEKEQSQLYSSLKPFYLELVTVKLPNGQIVNQKINIVESKK